MITHHGSCARACARCSSKGEPQRCSRGVGAATLPTFAAAVPTHRSTFGRTAAMTTFRRCSTRFSNAAEQELDAHSDNRDGVTARRSPAVRVPDEPGARDMSNGFREPPRRVAVRHIPNSGNARISMRRSAKISTDRLPASPRGDPAQHDPTDLAIATGLVAADTHRRRRAGKRLHRRVAAAVSRAHAAT